MVLRVLVESSIEDSDSINFEKQYSILTFAADSLQKQPSALAMTGVSAAFVE